MCDPFTRQVFADNHVFFVDSTLGHRNWTEWQRVSTKLYVRDRMIHNSILIVIRKRLGVVPPVKINFGSVAMVINKIITANESMIS